MTITNTSIPGARGITLQALALATLLLSGCASLAPQNESSTTAESATTPAIADVLEQPDGFQDSAVHWGGTIASVEFKDDNTWVEVIQRPLNRRGIPVASDLSEGRFLAVIPGFLEPTDYKTGQTITLTGNLDGSETRAIGDGSYDYPKVAVADHQLWTRSTRLASNGRRGYYYAPYYKWPFRSSISIGFGSRSAFGFRGRFGHSRYGFGHSRFGRHSRSRFRSGSIRLGGVIRK